MHAQDPPLPLFAISKADAVILFLQGNCFEMPFDEVRARRQMDGGRAQCEGYYTRHTVWIKARHKAERWRIKDKYAEQLGAPLLGREYLRFMYTTAIHRWTGLSNGKLAVKQRRTRRHFEYSNKHFDFFFFRNDVFDFVCPFFLRRLSSNCDVVHFYDIWRRGGWYLHPYR